MATWNNLKGSLFAAGRDVSQKAKEISEIAKLKMDIRSKEDYVEQQFAILGRAYYDANKEAVCEENAEQFAVIKEALDEIERMKQQLLDVQGVILCPNCGKKSPLGTSFCSGCGTRLEEIVVDAEVVSEEVVVEEPVTEESIFEEEVTEEAISKEAAADETVSQETVLEEAANEAAEEIAADTEKAAE